MAYTSLFFPPWSGSITYQQYDVVGGVSAGDPNTYFSTQPNNQGWSPSGVYRYNVVGYTRGNDTTVLTYTYTGGPFFAGGSMVSISGCSFDPTVNYTGMITAGGSGTITYLNAGWGQNQATVSAGIITTLCSPAWSTGCLFVPGYTTSVETQQNVIAAAFEPGYEQRQAASINPNTDQFNLVFTDRSNREAKAIRAFVQLNAGVYSFPIMIPIPELDNQPNQKFISTSGPRVVTKSWNINDVSFTVKRVFDF